MDSAAMHSPRTGPAQLAGYPPEKLYLNLERLQFGSQLLWRLIVNDGKAEATWTLEVERAVIDENALFGAALGDGECDAEDAIFGLARMDVARTEKHLEASTKIESFDAILIEFERFVVDGANEIFFSLYDGIEDGARAWIFLGLREHEGGEFFAGEFSGAIEQSAIEIFVDGNLTCIECGKAQIVAVLKIFPVELESVGGGFAGIAIPAIGENDAADIPEECGDA